MKRSDTGTEKGHLKHWSLDGFLFRKAFPPSSFHPDTPPPQNASDKGAAVLNKHTAKGILLPASDHFQAVFWDTSLALHFPAAA